MDSALRVWWIPQLGMKEVFHVSVTTIKEAALIINTLAQYDLFQLEHNIKPDYSNVGGLETLDENAEWIEWENEEGEDIMQVAKTLGYKV